MKNIWEILGSLKNEEHVMVHLVFFLFIQIGLFLGESEGKSEFTGSILRSRRNLE